MQRIVAQLSGLMSSLADVEKLAATLQADTDATRKACARPMPWMAHRMRGEQRQLYDAGLL